MMRLSRLVSIFGILILALFSSQAEGFVENSRSSFAPRTIASETVEQASQFPIRSFFPENNGFLGQTDEVFLMLDQRIDRFGGSDFSRFFSPQGTPEFARALPPGTSD